jgi:hypothetical protein
VLPRREDLSADRGVLIVSYASHKRKAYAFFLLQVGRGWDASSCSVLQAGAGGSANTCSKDGQVAAACRRQQQHLWGCQAAPSCNKHSGNSNNNRGRCLQTLSACSSSHWYALLRSPG